MAKTLSNKRPKTVASGAPSGSRAGSAPVFASPTQDVPGGEPMTFESARILRHKARLSGMNPNYWYAVEWSEDVKRGEVAEVSFWGQSIALYRGADDVVAALENRCAHRHIPLTMGHVRGCDLVCIYHGWKYGADGKLKSMSHDDFGKRMPKVGVLSYPVREKYGVVWIFPGHPELAEETPMVHIPEAEGERPWARAAFDYTWNAHHSMVIDNLCNLTHLYVHGKWVPYDQTHLAADTYEGDRITLTWEHTLRKDAMWPVNALMFRRKGTENTSDTFMVYDYPYQSALSNERVKSCNFMSPVSEDRTRVFTLQLWKRPPVPGLETSFGAATMQAAVTTFFKPVAKEIFRQDGATVEAEQTRLGENFFRPVPEPNHAVKHFDRLNVERWKAWRDSETSGERDVGAAPRQPKQI